MKRRLAVTLGLGAVAAAAALPARAQTPPRIVSVGSALTEIVYALGAEGLLVGVDTTSQYPTAPMQNTIMFIIIVWATFFVRVKPVSTRAKPACMKNTRNPEINIHMMLTAVVTSFAAPATLATVGASCAKAWLPNPRTRPASISVDKVHPRRGQGGRVFFTEASA